MRAIGAWLLLGSGALCGCANGDGEEMASVTCRSESGTVIFSDGFDRSSPEPQWVVTGGAAQIDGALGCPPPALRLDGGEARTHDSWESRGRTFAIDLRLEPGDDGDFAKFTVVQSANQSDSAYVSFIIEQHRVVVENRDGSGGGGEVISAQENRGQRWHFSFSIDASGMAFSQADDGTGGPGNGGTGYENAGPMLMKVVGSGAWFDNAAVVEP